jgi:hypothetical protein
LKPQNGELKDQGGRTMADAEQRASSPQWRGTVRTMRCGSWATIASAFVTATLLNVHAVCPAQATEASKAEKAQKKPLAEHAYTGKLPGNVEEMREYILAATQAGDISELKTAIEWNELKPDFGDEAKDDPIAYWKKTSADGEGRETLAALANILALPPARLAIGKDPENNIVYVWPYLAERPLGDLSPAEKVDLYRLVPPDAAKSMQEMKKWAWWRLAIGADGTWYTFRKYP